MLIGDSMNMVDEIRYVLDNNANLSPEFRNDLFELILIFNSRFPGVPLDDLKKHLEKLQVKRINKFLNCNVSMFDNKESILYLNSSKIDNGYDVKHVLMYELLNMISSNDHQTGFIRDGKFIALNVGYTEILANFLVGNEGDMLLYPDEAIATNLISTMLGVNVLATAYFTHNTDLLIDSLNKVGV